MSSRPSDIDDNALSPKEIRHEFVFKTVKDLLSGDWIFRISTNKDIQKQHGNEVMYQKLILDMEAYVAGDYQGQSLDAMEKELFKTLNNFKMSNWIVPNPNRVVPVNELQNLKDSIASMSKLLMQNQELLRKIVNWIESLRK